MKLGILVNTEFINALNDLNQKKLPATVAYKLSKITNLAATEQTNYFKLRKELVDKYVEKDENGKAKITTSNGQMMADFGENVNAFSDEVMALEQIEVDVQSVGTLDTLIAALDKAGESITPAQLNSLKFIFPEA